MEVLYPRCAGLDVHKDMVVACLRVTASGQVRREVRTVGTTTKALLDLSEWLASEGCSHIVMEATGVYWSRSGTSSVMVISRCCWRTRPM